MNSIVISVNLTRLRDVSDIRCTECQSSLELHQPDPERPDRLLGTCADCDTWYLMDVARGVMVLLPVTELLQEG